MRLCVLALVLLSGVHCSLAGAPVEIDEENVDMASVLLLNEDEPVFDLRLEMVPEAVEEIVVERGEMPLVVVGKDSAALDRKMKAIGEREARGGFLSEMAAIAEADDVVDVGAQLRVTEEEVWGLSHLCRVHTYMAATADDEQRRMLALWLRNWASLGLRPKVLRRQDCDRVFMMEYLPPSYGSDLQWFETDHFVKWMALHAAGGGAMLEYDMLGFRADLPLTDEAYCRSLPPEPVTHKDHVGSLVLGNRHAINSYVQRLIQVGHEEHEARVGAGARKIMVTDKMLASLHPDRLFGTAYTFPGLMALTPAKVIEEGQALGARLDRVEWANELLKLNVLNRFRVDIALPQEESMRQHPVHALLDTLRCPDLSKRPAAAAWRPTLPSALEDISVVLPVAEAACSVEYYMHGTGFADVLLKIRREAAPAAGRRPAKEQPAELGQKHRLLLLLEDPTTAAWGRMGQRKAALAANPVTRFFFGAKYADTAAFDYAAFSSDLSDLFARLEREHGLVIVLLDTEYNTKGRRDARLALEYSLGFRLPAVREELKNAPMQKVDRAWRAAFEDQNQADIIFYLLAQGHFEKRVGQAKFLEKQLVASTSELEMMPVKLEL